MNRRARTMAGVASLLIAGMYTNTGRSSETLAPADLSPIAGLFGVPASVPPARLLEPGDYAWQLTGAVASHALIQQSVDESLLLDGETVRIEFNWQQSRGRAFEFGITVPWVNHSSGGLDRLIESWHRLFALPDGDRDDLPDDQLTYRLRQNERAIIERSTAAAGLGDVRLSLSRQFNRTDTSALAAHLMLKLPTGDSDELTGSGASDLSVGLSGEFSGILGHPAIGLRANVGIAVLGDNDIEGLRNRSTAWYAGGSLRWQIGDRAALEAGLSGRQRVVASGLRALNETAVQVSVALSRRIGADFLLSAGFSEDIRVETYPDIVFMIRLSRPGRRR